MYVQNEGRATDRLTVVISRLILVACGFFGGCGPANGLINRDAPTDAYRSEKWTVCSVVNVRRVPKGLQCLVEGDRGAIKGPYGGFKFPASGAKGLSLDLLFTTTNSIRTAYVDGYNAYGVRVFRFQSHDKKGLSTIPRGCTFKPGRPVPGFLEVPSSGAEPAESFHVFVRIKPDTRASFEVTNVERCH